mgnify:CR=1 FL=1
MFDSVSDMLAVKINAYEADGDLEKSVAIKLSNRVKQVEHHLGKGHFDQALKHLEDFKKHLQKGKQQGQVNDSAYEELQHLVDRILK